MLLCNNVQVSDANSDVSCGDNDLYPMVTKDLRMHTDYSFNNSVENL